MTSGEAPCFNVADSLNGSVLGPFIEGATNFQVSPLFSIRTISLASLQSCHCVDLDAQCKVS